MYGLPRLAMAFQLNHVAISSWRQLPVLAAHRTASHHIVHDTMLCHAKFHARGGVRKVCAKLYVLHYVCSYLALEPLDARFLSAQ